jgi:soluble lytic murein transglycosylase-like protein
MRHSLLVTCLLLTAWTDPAGKLIEQNPSANANGVSVIEKSTTGVASDDTPPAGPAERTKQLIEFDAVAVAPPPRDEPNPYWALRELPAPISVNAFAALDAVADGFDINPTGPIPLPPHRAVPHTEVCEALASAAEVNDVPTPFFIRLIWQESGFRQNVISPAGAQGVAQFMPTTAAEHGLDDPFNPLQAVRASARMLRNLIHQFGNVGLAAAAYNAGPRRVQDWLDKKGKLPEETQNYVERITGKKAEQWKIKTAAAAPLRVPARAPCQREAGLYAANGPEQIPLPPVQTKDEPVKIAKAEIKTAKASPKAAQATTKTASAKSLAKPAAKDSDKNSSKVATAGEDKTPKTTAKSSGKTESKAKKVKVADAEARK